MASVSASASGSVSATTAISVYTNHQTFANFSTPQDTPPITIPIPRCIAVNEELQKMPTITLNILEMRNTKNYEKAIEMMSLIQDDQSVDYRMLYLRGVLKYEYSLSFPPIIVNVEEKVPPSCCSCFCQNDVRIVPKQDISATLAKRFNLMNGALQDLTHAFHRSADVVNIDKKVRSDISHSIAVIYKDLNDDPRVRAFISRAVELNPDNMNARQAFECHRRPVQIVHVETHTSTHVKAVATASAEASANSSSSS